MYASMHFSIVAALLVAWASADLGDECHLSTSRSLLQTRTQRGSAEERVPGPLNQEVVQHTQAHSNVVHTPTKHSLTHGVTRLHAGTLAHTPQPTSAYIRNYDYAGKHPAKRTYGHTTNAYSYTTAGPEEMTDMADEYGWAYAHAQNDFTEYNALDADSNDPVENADVAAKYGWAYPPKGRATPVGNTQLDVDGKDPATGPEDYTDLTMQEQSTYASDAANADASDANVENSEPRSQEEADLAVQQQATDASDTAGADASDTDDEYEPKSKEVPKHPARLAHASSQFMVDSMHRRAPSNDFDKAAMYVADHATSDLAEDTAIGDSQFKATSLSEDSTIDDSQFQATSRAENITVGDSKLPGDEEHNEDSTKGDSQFQALSPAVNEDHSANAVGNSEDNAAADSVNAMSELDEEPKNADFQLQAPEEGGQFSEFFNNLAEGRGIHSWLHYFPAYQRHFAQFVGQEVHIVHIAVESGGALAMWKNIFGPRARIYGVYDEPACKAYEEEQIEIFIGAQEKPTFWEDFKSKVPRVDILIDDGGHDVEQVVATMGNMLPHMSPNGIYVTQGVGQDMWRQHSDHESAHPDHQFWMFLHMEFLTSPAGQSYPGLGNFVSSIHIYPYIMVAELRENSNPDAINRQLASSENDQPTEIRTLTADSLKWSYTERALPSESSHNTTASSTKPLSETMMADLGSAIPGLEWKESGIFVMEEPVDELLETMPPLGWLIVRDPAADFSFDAAWDARADMFLNKISARFIALQRGLCCNPAPNRMQELVDSLHIYPHLLIVQMLEEKRTLAAPMHGNEWDPFNHTMLEQQEAQDEREQEPE